MVALDRRTEYPHRSLVAHLVRDEGVAGSNPATPTVKVSP